MGNQRKYQNYLLGEYGPLDPESPVNEPMYDALGFEVLTSEEVAELEHMTDLAYFLKHEAV